MEFTFRITQGENGSIRLRGSMMNTDNANLLQKGGARIDSWNVTIPYAVLFACRDSLRLSCLGQDYVFPKDRIIALSTRGSVGQPPQLLIIADW